jgi:hypothetical protein
LRCITADVRGAGEHQDRPRRKAVGQRLKSAEIQPDGGREGRLRRDEAQPVAARNAAGRVAECVGRAGHIEQHHIGQQHEHDVGCASPHDGHPVLPDVGAGVTQGRAPAVVTT